MAEAGRPLDPWQRDVMVDALGETGDGLWSATEVAAILPRQNGKGALLEAKALHALYLSGSELVLWSAHEFKTAREGFLRVRSLIDNCDDLRKRVRAVRTSHGEEGVELTNGNRLNFVARSRGSGRGFSGDDVILDEAYALGDEAMSALMPTLSARPNPQVWYTSSAPLAGSVVLRRLMKRGRAGDPGLAYLEWCAASTAASDDRRAWADANPALGIRISPSSIARELAAMDPYDFRRERLGVVQLDDEVEQVVAPEVWAALADARSQPLAPVAFGLDITPDRATASIAVAGLRADGRRHHEVVDHAAGTRWVVERVVALVGRWETCAVALDANSPAGSLIPDLERVGIRTNPDRGETRLEIVGSTTMAQACGGWYDAVTDDRARHIDQTQLNAALTGARQRPIGDGGWKWSRRDSSVDISPLVAVTVADYAHALHGHDPEPAEPVFAWA